MGLDRLLVASPYSDFLIDMMAQLSSEFEIHRAASEEVLLFLGREGWTPRLIILDGDSPFFEACQRIRQRFSFEEVGLFMVTQDLTPLREEKAFRAGCDHILAYPKSREAFLARIHSWQKRILSAQDAQAWQKKKSHLTGQGENSIANQETPLRFATLEIFVSDELIRRQGVLIPLTKIQFKLFMSFLNHPEKLLSRLWIKRQVWGGVDISLRSIDAQVSKLKKLLPELEPHLVNIYGKGYLLTHGQSQAAG